VNLLLESVGFGLVTGAIVALAAMGLSLQIGVTNVPNFAYGELLTFGAYGALIAQDVTKNLLLDCIAAIVAAGATAYAVNRFVLQSFINIKTRPIYLLIVTAGLSIVLQNLLGIFFGETTRELTLPGDASHPYRIGPFIWTRIDLFIMAGAAIVIVILYTLLQHTRFGRAQRAVADSPELARVAGVPVRRVVNMTWMIAGAVGGLAGLAIATTSGTLDPTMGSQFLLVVFAAAVLGGIGKPYGALAAGMIVGVAMEVSSAYVDAAYNQIIAVGILVIAILFRPSGLFSSAREAW
jgi:branched-chain amino acid transport system permease protein